jgi:hypothetical protein
VRLPKLEWMSDGVGRSYKLEMSDWEKLGFGYDTRFYQIWTVRNIRKALGLSFVKSIRVGIVDLYCIMLLFHCVVKYFTCNVKSLIH